MYMGASCYSTKNYRNFYRGNVLKNHPNCGMVSHTYQRAFSANSTYRKNVDAKRAASASSGKSVTTEKRKPMYNSDVAMFMVENNIHTELELKRSLIVCR